MNKIYQVVMVMLFTITFTFTGVAQNNFFSDKGENALLATSEKRVVNPVKFRSSTLDFNQMKSFLNSLPDETEVRGNWRNAPILTLPMPDGSFARFNVWESSIQEPELQAKFKEIRTYAGQGIDNPADNVRFDVNPYFGFSAQILSPNGRVFIDPFARKDINNYVSYYSKDAANKARFSCGVTETVNKLDLPNNIVTAACLGTQLRSYRLAQACTGEYSQVVAGGNPAATHAAIVTSVNRVSGVYETEVSIRFILIANNNLIEYTNPATDPYNNDGGGDLDLNTPNLNNVIGSANYDFGHLFCTASNAGVAYLSSVCNNSIKGGGLTGGLNPVGDGFDIDYVAHEMGHQFGGPHTMGGCGSVPASYKIEPGGGTTIMAYAGICGTQNLQPNSDPYFHSRSFDDISNFITTGGGSSCGTSAATSNQIPVINSLTGNGLNIPISTPFTLSATASDPDGDAITYSWEQMDASGTSSTVVWNAGATGAPGNTLPLFRFRVPKTTGVRTFPDIRVILAGYPANPPSQMDGLKGETLSPVSRSMKFKLTVRDNKAGGGGVASSGTEGCQSSSTYQINVINTSAPFVVTVPNGGESYPVGSSQNITWNTVGTENAPISVANVKISLSTDGGLTYPTVLLASTPNDGNENVTMPISLTTTARIKVEALGNIFFDISNANFSITSAFDLGNPAPVSVSCPAPNFMDIVLNTSQIGTFTNPISFTATGAPAGTNVTFTPTSVTANNPVTVRLNNTNTLAPGSYSIQVTGSAAGAPNVVRTLTYVITPTAGPAITTQPAPQTVCIGANASFTIASATATTFQWQVSTNGGGTWANLSNTAPYSGVTTATLNITSATATLNNYQYRCVASITCGNTNSNPGVLTVNALPVVTWPNALANQCANATTYALTGGLPTGGTYRFNNTDITNFNASAAGVGTHIIWYRYTNGSGCSDSISKTIVVNPFPTLTLTANSTNASPANTLSLLPGWSTTITAAMSTGPNATYVWQYQPLGTTTPATTISNTTNNYLVNVDRLGTYTIVGTSDQGCTSTAANITIKDSASTKLFIYPSPNDGRFSVAYHYPNASGTNTFKHNITIYSSLGKQMFTREYVITQPWKNIPVDLRNASAGVYYVVVRDANGNKVATGEVMVY